MKTQSKEIHAENSFANKSSLKISNHALAAALQELDLNERIAIFCRFWQAMSIDEISRELGLSWNLTDQIINRSLQKLRERFTEKEIQYFSFKESTK